MDHLRRKASRYEMDRRKMVEQEVSSLLDRLSRCTQRRRGTQSERDELKEVDTLKKDILSFPKEFTREEFEHLLLSTIASPLLRFAQGYRNSGQIFDELDNSESTIPSRHLQIQSLLFKYNHHGTKLLKATVAKRSNMQYIKLSKSVPVQLSKKSFPIKF